MGWLGYHVARELDGLVQRELASPDRGDDYILPDERARQRACALLAEDPEVDAQNVNVRVLSGELMLAGSVPTAAMKVRSAEICASIEGVTKVDNTLSVK